MTRPNNETGNPHGTPPKPNETPKPPQAPAGGKPEQQYVIDALAGESWRLFRIMGEFVQGFEEMSDVTKAVTIFGSARLREVSSRSADAP